MTLGLVIPDESDWGNGFMNIMKTNFELINTFLAGDAGTIVWDEIPTGPLNGVNKVFTLDHAPRGDKAFLFFFAGKGGGVPLVNGLDYIISGVTLTYTDIVLDSSKGESHRIMYNY